MSLALAHRLRVSTDMQSFLFRLALPIGSYNCSGEALMVGTFSLVPSSPRLSTPLILASLDVLVFGRVLSLSGIVSLDTSTLLLGWIFRRADL